MKVKLRRHRHNLSNYQIGTCNPGELIPVCVAPVIPGDTFNHRITGLTRFLPMNAPIMHRVNVYYYSFFMPTRLMMTDWEDFITRSDPAAVFPTLTLGNIKANANCARLADYLGINTASVVTGSTTTVSALPFIMYNACYNEWMRDKDFITPLDTIGATVSDFAVRKAAWRKDTYTTARSTPQLGQDLTLPMGTTAPVSVGTVVNHANHATSYGQLRDTLSTTGVLTSTVTTGAAVEADIIGTADLENATGPTVRAFRRIMNLQALAERLGNFGHDYPSLLASMGVKSSDARLQRPEYLGGGKAPISFSEVLRTGDDDTGEMFGHGIGPSHAPAYRRFFEEYGYVMTFMVVRPEPVYDSVIPRHWFDGVVDGPNDFYTPELERIGFQEIYNKEIWPQNPASGDETVWGYAPRYNGLRGIPSQTHQLFRGGQSLSYWTWARKFESFPALNQEFIECTPDTDIFQDTAGQNIIYGVNNHLIAQRMLTKNITGRII